MLTNYDVTAIIATCALLLSLAFWITLKKRWLPQLKTDIIAEAPEIGKKTYDLIKQDLPDVKQLFTDELPNVITAFKKELPLMMKEQAPKLIETFLKDISERVADPEEEQTKILLSTMALQGMAAFRACMHDADFKREVDDYIRGKTNMVRSEIEKSLPGIFVKAAPEIKKALLGDGAPGEGGDSTFGFLGMFIPPEFRQMLGGGR